MAHVRKQAQAIIDPIATSNLNRMEILRTKHAIEMKMIKPNVSWAGRGSGLRRDISMTESAGKGIPVCLGVLRCTEASVEPLAHFSMLLTIGSSGKGC